MKRAIAVILLSFVSFSAAADELNYAQWERLFKMASEPVDRPSYLPNKMSPVTDPNGVVQQIVNYNLEELKKTNSTVKMLESEWGSHNTIAAQATKDGAAKKADPSATTFHVKPFETKAWVDFGEKFKASYNFQVVNHTSELMLAPKQKVWGMTVGLSYVVTSADQQNRLSIRYDW